MSRTTSPPRRTVLLWSAAGLLTAASAACTASVAAGPRSPRSTSGGGQAPGAAAPAVATTPQPTVVPTRDPSTCIWRDEFDGAAGTSPSKALWTAQTGAGGWGNGELQAYTDSRANLALDGRSSLAMTMLEQPTTDAQGRTARYTSSRIISREPVRAGRLEARMNVTTGPGLWSAFWTLGEGWEQLGWPACGEIDVVEVFDDATTFDSVVHAANASDPSGRWRSTSNLPAVPKGGIGGVWHDYAVDITDDRLVFSVDGVAHHQVDRADAPAGAEWPFDRPQHVLLDLAMARWAPAKDHPALPATLLVDWVRAYPRA